jgi:hypothetical protein
MQAVSRKILLIKLSVVAVAVLFAVFGFYQFAADYQRVGASAFGPTPAHTGAPNESNCTSCHVGQPINTAPGMVSINGLPVNYLPNQIVPVVVTVSHPDAIIFGFQLTAIDNQGKRVGTFSLPAQSPQQLQIVNGFAGGQQRTYVQHTVDGTIPTAFGVKVWTFIWNAPATRAGKVSFYVAANAADSNGGTSGDLIYTSSKGTLTGTAKANFDADGKSDISVFRPSNGVWYSLNSTNGNLTGVAFGAAGDIIAPGDYDGDGKDDYAVFRPSNGVWYIQRSTGGFVGTAFGANGDVPVVGDYDGDLKSDIAVFRPSNGVWYILQSSNSQVAAAAFGAPGDKVAQGDYDGDAKTDVAVFRPSNGVWYIQQSRNGFTGISFGANGDKPVQGDYDGDGKMDVAVFRPSNGVWYLQQSRDGFTGTLFGVGTDKPVPADYDGDGRTDIAVVRAGIWYLLQSTEGFKGVSFGEPSDIPVPSGYLAQ